MKKLGKLWTWLNGNKTIIFGTLFGFLQLSVVKDNTPTGVMEVLDWGIGSMAALSLGHHVSKGYFSTKVGNEGQTLTGDPLKNLNVEK